VNEASRADELPTVLIAGPLPPAVGGMATVIDNLLESKLVERFHLVAFDTNKTTPEGRSLWAACKSRLAQCREWWRMLGRPRGPAVAHIHTCSGLIYAFDGILLLLSRLRGVPAILHIHGGGFETFLRELGSLRHGAAWLARRAARVVVLSEGWRERLVPLLPGAFMTVIPNTVPIPHSVEAREGFRAGGARILFLGALCEPKGVFDLVEACRDLPEDVTLDMAGAESEQGFAARLETLIDEYGLGERITLLGPVLGDEKIRLFMEHDVFVLPSYVEGLPMSLLEAMAYGMAIVTTDVGAIPSAVKDGKDAIVIKPGDVPALIRALLELIDNASLCEALAANARRRCIAEYGEAIGTQRLTALYEDVLGDNSRKPFVTN